MLKSEPIPLSNMNAEFVPRAKKPFVFTKFIYNSENGAVLGRTGASWAKVVIFYTAFYSVLAVVVAIQLWSVLRKIDPNIPKWQLYNSLIGNSPGLGFRPRPPEGNLASTLISYNSDEIAGYWHLVDSLDDFLIAYKIPLLSPGRGQNIYNCDYETLPPQGAVCDVDVRAFGPCTQENYYGYHRNSPCVFLKLNKIYGWIPDFYNVSTELPDDMPQSLKNHISDIEQTQSYMMNTIWVSCEGENPVDQEGIGPLSYYPGHGFPGYFYPYKNLVGYLSPLVAVHFEQPMRGVIINVECKAWARNIYYNRKERLGSVHYELLIE